MAARSPPRSAAPPAPSSTSAAVGTRSPPATRAAAPGARSPGLPRLLAEQSARLQDHDQDQVAEHDGRGPLWAQPGVRKLLDAADDQPAQQRPTDVPDPA